MNGMSGEDAYILGMDYTEESLLGAGALKGQDGKDGVSPIISVNTSTADTYKLDITDKNGTITTPNLVGKQGLQGIQGEQGKPADNPVVTENADNTEDVYKLDLTVGETVFTTKNIIGKQGLEGVSPSVTTNPDNTAEDYRLNITTKGGTFTTPNLRGPVGPQGEQGESAASAINPRGDYDVNAEPHYTISDYITSAEGNTYVCKKDNPDNVAPTDGTVNDEFWQILALRGAQGIAGKDGEKGADGVTFTPSIDVNGVLSFTNNGGLENPEPIDIKGDNGVTFTPSIDADGYLSFTNNGNLENPEPIKVLGQDGADGIDGVDGTTYIPSIGTVTTVESNADASAGVTIDEETKEAVFHFELPKGEKGFSPIVETVESENGHTVNIADVEGVKSFEVLNGKDGVQIDDETTSTDTVWSSKKTSDEIDALISDTSSKTSTYSSAKIDEKYDDKIFGYTGGDFALEIQLDDRKIDIEIVDNCGGKIELLGNGVVDTSLNYRFIKVLRLSYGNWTEFDATKQNDTYTKIKEVYVDTTNKKAYVHLKGNANYIVKGAKSVISKNYADVDTSTMTLIPESQFASKSDLTTTTKLAQGGSPFTEMYASESPYRKLTAECFYGRQQVFKVVGSNGYSGKIFVVMHGVELNNATVKVVTENGTAPFELKYGNTKALAGSGRYSIDLFIHKTKADVITLNIIPVAQGMSNYTITYTSADFVTSTATDFESAEKTATYQHTVISDSSTSETSTWSSSKIASEATKKKQVMQLPYTVSNNKFSVKYSDVAALIDKYCNFENSGVKQNAYVPFYLTCYTSNNNTVLSCFARFEGGIYLDKVVYSSNDSSAEITRESYVNFISIELGGTITSLFITF